ncbi:MAG TPA: receptor ligand binding family protein [Cyanobacteria bacterium UBA11159]|nr:receptor ligand binding family protein [Cyanobacteria bacterium UBA11367]HBE59850.1 receptor ligand binding family protein [Cyanobacteria bacterium UBA11366]HBK63845.1 receptor ligand binding family protein [Cyanobacteria bacterium UBA11166]HBR72626.1 receptor ligand binding family protein [Cyanobacteria bacterium UBA11159]HBS69100.1 receptor ligand binding family protein [Cyanobacteria bacterium UBA11153]HCA95194.1 receptor ligand binding family protein [Cyanobacteria bacterium UBA9226]
MSQKNETTVLVLSLAATLALVIGGIWFGRGLIQSPTQTSSKTPNSATSNQPVKERISTGEKLLVTTDTTPDKQAGINAIASKNYNEAVSKLETALKRTPNDPEILIYLNNARIGNQKSYSIAVSVPITSDVNGAKEILRGVAQAQNEVNLAGGIKGIPLKVVIGSDDNMSDVAKEVAEAFVKNSEILGVIGHYASDVTLATVNSYQSGELAVISPISTSVKLSGASSYVFRTVPSDYVAARALADYMLQKLQQKNVAVFFNSQSGYSQSLKSEFVTAVALGGGQVMNEFDLSSPNFDPASNVNQAMKSGAQVIMLAANTGTLDKALQVIQVNSKKLSLLGGDDVYSPKTLQIGREAAINMVVAIPWHILANPNAEFPKAASKLWGAEVNWRTAMAYDAAKALIAGIERNPSRKGVQQALSASDFAAEGASGAIRFLPSGDRNQAVQLVKIVKGSRTSFGYEFVPVP